MPSVSKVHLLSSFKRLWSPRYPDQWQRDVRLDPGAIYGQLFLLPRVQPNWNNRAIVP